jgi:hypothetical protein
MTEDLLREAVRKALRETIPANNNDAGQVMRVEHSGTINLRIEIVEPATAQQQATPPAVPTTGASPAVAMALQRAGHLLRHLEAYKPVGHTWERSSAPGSLVLHPAPWLRRVLRNEP